LPEQTGNASDVVLEVRGVTKDHRGLRPLRIERLELRAGESLALLGFDLATAEVLVNLIIGAAVPDTGDVKVFGQLTTWITDVDPWLRGLDRFGLLTDRALLLDPLTAEQNLAMPYSLEIDALPAAIRERVESLAAEVGLETAELSSPVAQLPAASRLRVRLGRALALGPSILLAEHPNASLSHDEGARFAGDLARIVAERRLTSLLLTADLAFARRVAPRVLSLHPATGELRTPTRWSSLFS
jgi:predicted ABC-type transport system involved in lysophospholipase L1 biosynthesis ATPase subunit